MTRIAIIDVASIEELARNGHMRTPLPRELEAIELCLLGVRPGPGARVSCSRLAARRDGGCGHAGDAVMKSAWRPICQEG
jgi:hypothetical protein